MDSPTDDGDSVLGAESDVDRSRAGSSFIAYPASADMMDPVIVRMSEPAYWESQPNIEDLSTGALSVPCHDNERPLCRAVTSRLRSVRAAKSPRMLSSCIVASSGSIRIRILCWPERTGIICDRLP